MAFLHIKNVAIRGISSAVSKTVEEVSSTQFMPEDLEKLIQSTGINKRHIADPLTTTSDLCYESAEKIITDLSWDKSEIECLVFVSQTPDYILPATAPILQHRLGLNSSCMAFDISLGCSGWVYGLSVISALLQAGTIKKGLLLVGDTISKIASDRDKSTWPLFGDAGTCTAIEYENGNSGFRFGMYTDGSGAETIMIKDGGYRHPFNQESLQVKSYDNNLRSNVNLFLDGMDVFTFGISKIPKTVKTFCTEYDIDINKIDYFVFHQANMMMNEMIRKKLKIEESKVPYSLSEYGNTSSATIPLTICSELKNLVGKDKIQLIACGFGVGLSWGIVDFTLENIVISEIIYL